MQVLLRRALHVTANQGNVMRDCAGCGLATRHLEHFFAHHDRDPLVALLPFILLFDQLDMLRQFLCGRERRTGRLRHIPEQLLLQICGHH